MLLHKFWELKEEINRKSNDDYYVTFFYAGFIVAPLLALMFAILKLTATSSETGLPVPIAEGILMFLGITGLIGVSIGMVISCFELKSFWKGFGNVALMLLFFVGTGLVVMTLSALSQVGTTFVWPVVVALLLGLTELLFWLTPLKPLGVGQNVWLKTAWHKFVCFYEAFVILSVLNVARYLVQFYKITDEVILRWLGYAGVGLLVLGVVGLSVFVLLWLNSFKFRRKQAPTEEIVEEPKQEVKAE